MKDEEKRSLEIMDDTVDVESRRRRALSTLHVPDKVVASIDALLRLENDNHNDDDDGYLNTPDNSCIHTQDERDFHVSVVSDFFVSRANLNAHQDGTVIIIQNDEACLECVRLLLLVSESHQNDNHVQQACQFLLDPQYTPYYSNDDDNESWEPPMAHLVLWWELRAQIQRRLAIQRQQQSSFLLKSSDVIADTISASAHVIERGLRGSVPYLDVGLEFTGNTVKRILTPHDTTPSSSSNNNKKLFFKTPKDEVVTLTYADAASRMSSTVHRGAKTTVNTIRDASTGSIQYLCGEFERREMGPRLVPHPTHRHVLSAVGNVGLASVGAVCIVGEAAWEVTRQVAHKTAYVTADVIRYKYGDAAGTLAEHVSDTTGNVVRTAAHVAMLEKTVLAKVVAKNSVKAQVARRRSSAGGSGGHHMMDDERGCESDGDVEDLYAVVDTKDDDDDEKVPPPRSKSL